MLRDLFVGFADFGYIYPSCLSTAPPVRRDLSLVKFFGPPVLRDCWRCLDKGGGVCAAGGVLAFFLGLHNLYVLLAPHCPYVCHVYPPLVLG